MRRTNEAATEGGGSNINNNYRANICVFLPLYGDAPSVRTHTPPRGFERTVFSALIERVNVNCGASLMARIAVSVKRVDVHEYAFVVHALLIPAVRRVLKLHRSHGRNPYPV